MSLLHIAAILAATLVIYPRLPLPARRWALALGSLAGLYWLQPASPIRYLDYWLPTIALLLTILVWAAVRPAAAPVSRQDWLMLAAAAGLAALIALNRYLQPFCCLTPTLPPPAQSALVFFLGAAVLTIPALRLSGLRRLYTAGVLTALLALLVVLKSEAGSTWLSAGLRALNAQATASANPLDIRWLGYSYLAFRLIHLLRDGADGKLGPVSLQAFLAYTLFLPAYTAGPIDRYQRFSKDLENPLELEAGRLEGLRRLAVGLFKKFAVADSLALLALSPQNSADLISTPWAWVTLYGYALRLYFDFSGYTDIAIGLGLCLGFRLPENFQGPYLKTNLTQFWNAWHITLTQWLRGYVYNPLMRALRRRAPAADPRGMILFGQISVMLLIGLWHGLNWNFAIWGLWHAAGLFINGQWSEWLRARQATQPLPERMQPALRLAGWAVTFQYVTLGWVWFALPDQTSALRVFGLLFGL